MIEKGECGAFSPDLLQCFLKIAPSLPEILQSDDGLPAVVYHYQHPNTEKFSGKKCYNCDMDKNSRVARLLEIEREKQKALFAMSGDIIFDYDVEKDLIIFSDEYKKVFGGECVVTNARVAMGSSMVILPEDLQELRDLTHALTEENSGYVKDVRLIDKFGEEKWYRLHVNSIWDKEHYGVMLSIVGRMISIDKMKREIGLWKRQAESDALTKLGNRAYGERLLQQLLCEPQKEKAAVMFLDVDNFKMVNDRHGHLFGDEVLCRIANEISRQFRSNDIVCRIGGDEFLIIMQNVRDSGLALLKADDLRAGIERLGREADIQVPLSVSVGVSFYPVDGTDEKTLLYKADKALYEAKKRGKNNCVIYGKELEAEPFMSQITVAESE